MSVPELNVSRVDVNAWCAVYPDFAESLHDVAIFMASKPDIALFKLRQVLEQLVKSAYTPITGQLLPDKFTLADLLEDSAFIDRVPSTVSAAMQSVREWGNRAVHNQKVTTDDAARELRSMDHILRWWSAFAPGAQTPDHRRAVTTRVMRHSQGVLSITPLMLGVAITLVVAALVWFYVANLGKTLDKTQRAWLQRQQPSSPLSNRTSSDASPALNSAALSNDAVVLTHPSTTRDLTHKPDEVIAPSGAVYLRNYPSSWPAPFFQEEIKPGGWGTWLEEPNWRREKSEQDFVWYRAVEAAGVEETQEWAIQCEDEQGMVRDVSPGHNHECETLRRIRVRNDWQRTAFVYYFAKHNTSEW